MGLGVKYARGPQENVQSALSAQQQTQLAHWVSLASWVEACKMSVASTPVAKIVVGRIVQSWAGIAPTAAEKRLSLQRNHAKQICHPASSKAKREATMVQTV